MILTITTSGGVGGFGLLRSVRIEVDELPEPLRAETCARLDADSLAALSPRPAPGAADMIVYHIVVEGDRAAPAPFDLPQSALSDETLDLIDDLLSRAQTGAVREPDG